MERSVYLFEKFEELLLKNNITIYKVAKDCEIPLTSLYNWKSGNSRPNVNNMKKIADYFGVSIEYFL